MPSQIIQRQMIEYKVMCITKFLTNDPSRFSRMADGKGRGLGSFEGYMASIKKLTSQDWFYEENKKYCELIREFLDYIESGKPLWCLLKEKP